MLSRRPVMTMGVALLASAALAACGTTVPLAGRSAVGGGVDGLSTTAPGGGTDAPVTVPTGSAGTTGTTGSLPQSGPAPVTGPAGAGPSTAASSAPGTTAVVPGGGAASAIPLKGPGWDAKSIYVGVPTADDFNTVAKNLGANFNNGSVHGDVEAVIAAINQAGGVFGRKLVPAYHDASTVSLTSNPSSVAQSMCAYFTQDRPVVAVLNGAPQLDAEDGFHRCLEQKKTTLLSFSNTDYSDKDYTRLGPHLFTVASLSTDILVPTFVSALNRQGFFSGWDTTLGQAGKTAVKVGILLPDTPSGHHVGDVMRASLKQLGITVASDFFYDAAGTGNKSQSEVLRFSAAKVTHVLDLPPIAAELSFFEGSAEQQHYRPRYGFTSFNLPLSAEQNTALAPPAQQVGSMGIGWQPLSDANAAHDPGALPGTKRCFAALTAGGQKFDSSQRRAAFIGVQFCDALYLLRDAMLAGRGFAGADLLRGMPIAGPKLLTAGTFASTLSSTNHGVPGFYVDQVYSKACACFTYVGGKRPFTRATS